MVAEPAVGGALEVDHVVGPARAAGAVEVLHAERPVDGDDPVAGPVRLVQQRAVRRAEARASPAAPGPRPPARWPPRRRRTRSRRAARRAGRRLPRAPGKRDRPPVPRLLAPAARPRRPRCTGRRRPARARARAACPGAMLPGAAPNVSPLNASNRNVRCDGRSSVAARNSASGSTATASFGISPDACRVPKASASAAVAPLVAHQAGQRLARSQRRAVDVRSRRAGCRT